MNTLGHSSPSVNPPAAVPVPGAQEAADRPAPDAARPEVPPADAASTVPGRRCSPAGFRLLNVTSLTSLMS